MSGDGTGAAASNAETILVVVVQERSRKSGVKRRWRGDMEWRPAVRTDPLGHADMVAAV